VNGLQPGDQIGLVHYGSSVTAYGEGVPGSYFQYGLSPTINATNIDPIQNELIAAITAMHPTDFTNTWDSLKKGRERIIEGLTHHLTISDPARSKAILFLTDGYPCCVNGFGGPNWDTDPHNPSLDPITPANYNACDNDPNAFHPPYLAERMISASTFTNGQTRDKAQMVLYTHTINEAIKAQRAGITVHVIGMGNNDTLYDPGPEYPAAVPPIPYHVRPAIQRNVGRNPFQDYRDAGPVKELFLSYVANDQPRMQNPPAAWISFTPPVLPPERPYFWDFPCSLYQPSPLVPPQVVTGAQRAGDPRGIYAFAETGPEVTQLFNEIIRASRIRFVE